MITDLNLARALRFGAHLPIWASIGKRTWSEAGYRLIFPLYGTTGRIESLRARRVTAVNDTFPKETVPRADKKAGEIFEVRGLCMTDPLARLLLAGRVMADGRPAADAVEECGLVIVEGSPDFLTACERWVRDANEAAPAVIGVFSGSWTPELAARVPDGTRVVVRTHADDAGDKYFRKIADTLGGRCRVLRMRRPTD